MKQIETWLAIRNECDVPLIPQNKDKIPQRKGWNAHSTRCGYINTRADIQTELQRQNRFAVIPKDAGMVVIDIDNATKKPKDEYKAMNLQLRDRLLWKLIGYSPDPDLSLASFRRRSASGAGLHIWYRCELDRDLDVREGGGDVIYKRQPVTILDPDQFYVAMRKISRPPALIEKIIDYWKKVFSQYGDAEKIKEIKQIRETAKALKGKVWEHQPKKSFERKPPQEYLNDKGVYLRRGYGVGNHRCLCPQCSHLRKNKKEECVSVDIFGDGGVAIFCHNCQWKGD